jgi:hypothetical protein
MPNSQPRVVLLPLKDSATHGAALQLTITWLKSTKPLKTQTETSLGQRQQQQQHHEMPITMVDTSVNRHKQQQQRWDEIRQEAGAVEACEAAPAAAPSAAEHRSIIGQCTSPLSPVSSSALPGASGSSSARTGASPEAPAAADATHGTAAHHQQQQEEEQQQRWRHNPPTKAMSWHNEVSFNSPGCNRRPTGIGLFYRQSGRAMVATQAQQHSEGTLNVCLNVWSDATATGTLCEVLANNTAQQ